MSLPLDRRPVAALAAPNGTRRWGGNLVEILGNPVLMVPVPLNLELPKLGQAESMKTSGVYLRGFE
jgi:hypothetical protein